MEGGGTPIRNPFRFEKLWIKDRNFKELVGKWWEEMEPISGNLMYQFQQKLRKLKAKLRTWNKEEFGDTFQENKILKDKLEEIQREGMDNGYTDDLKHKEQVLLVQLSDRERQEENYWKQKSRNQWLQEGERNIKLFHHTVVHNHQREKLMKLKKDNGKYDETREDMEKELV